MKKKLLIISCLSKKKKLINIVFPKHKIYKNVESSKVKINNYLNDEKVIAINEIETEFCKQKLDSVSFDKYMKKKINIKNMIHSIIICNIGAEIT